MEKGNNKNDQDTEQSFNVISTGEILDGYEIEDVKRAVASIFQVNVAVANDIVGVGERIIKRNLSRKNAERFVQAFLRAGLRARLEPTSSSARPATSPGARQKSPDSSSRAERPLAVRADSATVITTTHRRSPGSFVAGILVGLVLGGMVGYFAFGPWRVPLFGLTTAEQAQVAALDEEVSRIRGEIAQAEAERAKLAGGLVAALIDARLEIERGTKALLEQRVRAIRAGISIRQDAPGAQPDIAKADQIAVEIRTQTAQVERARIKSERFGGLVGAIQHTTLATEEQTLASLRLAEVSARYGLPGVQNSAANFATSLQESQAESSSAEENALPDLPVHEGPFGLAMGISLDELETTPIPNAPGKYVLKRVPRPHPSFESYLAQIAPRSGLCWIKAIGRDIQADSYGISVRSAYTSMRDKLASIYGQSYDEKDMLLPGSIWDEPREWMMAMKQGERHLVTFWRSRSGHKLPNDLSSMAVAATARSSHKAFIAVEYQFQNEAVCDAEINAVTDDVF